jgi:shikimate dehydrogenase
MLLKAEQRKLLLGLIGAAIQTSRLPAIHEQESAEHGIRCIYQLIDLDELNLTVAWLPELLAAAERMGFSGLNITHPCKQKIIPFLTDLSDDAHLLGTVNTVLLRNGKRIGYNTEWSGFAETLPQQLPEARMEHVVQLGAGGAGTATAYALLKMGVKQLTISDWSVESEEQLVDLMALHFGERRAQAVQNLAAAVANADGLIHATPTGLVRYPGMPLPRSLLRPELWVADLASVTYETELIRTARELGCRTMDGTLMAVYQAVKSFELFTGIVPDTNRMALHFTSQANRIAPLSEDLIGPD